MVKVCSPLKVRDATSRPSQRSRRLGSASYGRGEGHAAGADGLYAIGQPLATRAVPRAWVVNGFQSEKAAKSVRTSQTRLGGLDVDRARSCLAMAMVALTNRATVVMAAQPGRLANPPIQGATRARSVGADT
jgi:hypothetical protein